MDLTACKCERVVRLEIPGRGPVWICNLCNAQFVPQKAVEYKIGHLIGTLRILSRKEEYEQIAGVWREEGIQVS